MFCSKCGNALSNDASFCPRCGTAQPKSSADMFCSKCGNKIIGNAKFCLRCGQTVSQIPTENPQRAYAPINNSQALLKKFSERVQINGIIWLVISIIQILLGLFVQWVLLIVGILNLITSIRELKFSKSVLQNPVGIINYAKPLTGPIIALIYNIIFGGIIGVAGSIYYLVAVRGLAMENESYFLEIEENFNRAL